MLTFMAAQAADAKAKLPVNDALIRDIASGSMDALHTLYIGTSKSIYAFALSITKNPQDAEDVLQSTFLTIYSKADTYRPLGKPMAWIFTIARNFALMKLRERGKTDALDTQLLESNEAFARVDSAEQRLILQAAMNTLADEERHIVLLHAMNGLKNREIAAALNIPIGTALSKYHRAIRKLQVILKKEGYLP